MSHNFSRKEFIISSASLLGVTLRPNIAKATNSSELLSSSSNIQDFTFDSHEDATYIESNSSLSPASVSTLADNTTIQVSTIGGVDRYETSAKIAQKAFNTCKYAVIASGENYADSISGSALAGALNCPILITQPSQIPTVIMQALTSLQVKNTIILGGPEAVGWAIDSQLKSITGNPPTRIYGNTRYETQQKIYEYGLNKSYWANGDIAVATGADFADALSFSPIAYALKIPVIFCEWTGNLPLAQLNSIKSLKKPKHCYLLGGRAAVSQNTESQINSIIRLSGGETLRLGGTNRYETSVKISEYAVKNLQFSWDQLAVTSGTTPYDALSGGALQGKRKAVMLLADAYNTQVGGLAKQAGGSVTSQITYFGGMSAIPMSSRAAICKALGIPGYDNLSVISYNISRARMAQLQVARKEGYGATYSDFFNALDVSKYQLGDTKFLQFLMLNAGYTNISADAINSYLAKNVVYQESSRRRTSILRGCGQYFVTASQVYGVNEAYLVAHAIWETGWGCSDLAIGWKPSADGSFTTSDGKTFHYYKNTTYYNFFGIGAYDSDPLNGGRKKAVAEGWTSPEKAIAGGAQWVSANYLERKYQQNTLFTMKFDLAGAAATGSAWHEYCTGLDSWILGIANLMGALYKLAGISLTSKNLYYRQPEYTE